jgi:hypothetical protein
MRLIFWSILCASIATVVFADDEASKIEGLWGFEAAPDMTCRANPTKVTYLADSHKLSLKWPKTVAYSDGSKNDAVTFTVISVRENKFKLKRDRDGIIAHIVLADDFKSYFYYEKSKNSGSRFDRCDAPIS